MILKVEKPVGVPAAELAFGCKALYGQGSEKCNREINTGRHSPDEQIKSERLPIEDSQETVYISLDDIGVKHQKEHRSEETEKNGVYVWNTVAHIETYHRSYTVTGIGMKRFSCTCCLTCFNRICSHTRHSYSLPMVQEIFLPI